MTEENQAAAPQTTHLKQSHQKVRERWPVYVAVALVVSWIALFSSGHRTLTDRLGWNGAFISLLVPGWATWIVLLGGWTGCERRPSGSHPVTPIYTEELRTLRLWNLAGACLFVTAGTLVSANKAVLAFGLIALAITFELASTLGLLVGSRFRNQRLTILIITLFPLIHLAALQLELTTGLAFIPLGAILIYGFSLIALTRSAFPIGLVLAGYVLVGSTLVTTLNILTLNIFRDSPLPASSISLRSILVAWWLMALGALVMCRFCLFRVPKQPSFLSKQSKPSRISNLLSGQLKSKPAWGEPMNPREDPY